ncbi:Protein kinase, putative [Hondaea fermentalgiana]|uniref:Protein kinase, putative n=1 Tax=Hondaea fermentalgiana TaxID=2315210 RepID=A0A2R5G8I8_9STRA|nr:Protein kinase, putative [Hondaea fermentalgiana]|eukprot:GBG24793.1 Protein kinase, putative [Hondaea fermentalgiana]
MKGRRALACLCVAVAATAARALGADLLPSLRRAQDVAFVADELAAVLEDTSERRLQQMPLLDVQAVPKTGGFVVMYQVFDYESDVCIESATPSEQYVVVAGVCQRRATLASYRVLVAEHETGVSLKVTIEQYADSFCEDLVSTTILGAYPEQTDVARGEIDTGLVWSQDSASWTGNEALIGYEYSACVLMSNNVSFDSYVRVLAVTDAVTSEARLQTKAEVARVVDETQDCGIAGLPWASWIITTSGTPSWFETAEESLCVNTPDADSSTGWSMRVTCDASSTGTTVATEAFVYEYANCIGTNEASLVWDSYALQGDCGGSIVTAIGPSGSQDPIDFRLFCSSTYASGSGTGTGTGTGNGNDGNTTTDSNGTTGDGSTPPDTFSTGTNNRPSGPAPGVWVGVIPTLLLLGAVVYVLLTKKKKKKKKRGQVDDDDDDLEGASLPRSGKGKRTGRMSMLGYSLSLMRLKLFDDADDDEDPQSDDDDEDGNHHHDDDDDDDDMAAMQDASELEFGKLIGRGGAGKVFMGKFRGSRVAIKEYLGGRTHSSFAREIRNLRKLHHPNIIRIYGAVDSDLHRLVVMEYAPNSLAQVIDPSGLPPAQRPSAVALLQWSQELASGLSFLHSKGMIHFDIKPENVLLDEAWNVKICDFGVTRSMTSVLRPPSTNDQEGGTVAYTAPEMITGDRGQLSAKVDVYAFGILFWQLFHHGADPHPADWTVVDILTNVSIHGYRPDIDPTTPPHIADIILGAWETDVKSRFDMDDICEALHEILGPRSVDIVDARSNTNAPAFERGQQVYVFDQANQTWLPKCPATITGNRNNRNKSYPVLGLTVHEDNIVHQ